MRISTCWAFFIVVRSAYEAERVVAENTVGETRGTDVEQVEARAVQLETQHAPSEKSKTAKQTTALSRPTLRMAAEFAVLNVFEKISKSMIVLAYTFFLVLCASLCLMGLPSRRPQDPRVKEGCSTSCWIFMGLIYAMVYFSTDQYVPLLPQMGEDLGGSESVMSGTVQINLFVKAIFGLLASGLSDHIGRRPVVLCCIFILSAASFCCATVNQVEWFVLARVLQGMGMAIEPVIFAMARDYFDDPEERVRIIAALQMIAYVGIALAPLFGGVCAKILDWRSSFLSLAVIWFLMGLYACFSMMECCPDNPHQEYFKGVQRVLDPYLVCLLLSESFIMGAYFIFNANSSYLAEVNFGTSMMDSSMIMVGFAVICCLGAWLFDQIPQLSVLSLGRWASALLATSGILSLGLTACSNDLWAYLVGSFLQATVMIPSLVSANVLFFEPLEDCAGMAASFEILAQSVLPSLFSALATQSMMSLSPAIGLQLPQASCCVLAGAVFWWGCRAEGKQKAADRLDTCLLAEQSLPEQGEAKLLNSFERFEFTRIKQQIADSCG